MRRGACIAPGWRLLFVALAVHTASCAMIGSADHFEPDRAAARPGNVRVQASHVTAVPVGVHFGGQPDTFAVDIDGGRLAIASSDFSWDQDLVGPILPVFPSPMGAGTYRSEIELHVTAAEANAPIALVPAELGLVPLGASDPVAPTTCGRLPMAADELAAPQLPTIDAVELRRGEGIWLRYPCDNLETAAFDLLLPAGVTPSASPADRALRFQRSRSRFLAFFLPIPLG